MALDPKMKKAIYATIWTIFLGIACFVTVYATTTYLWQHQQQGEQEVTYAVEVNYKNFTLARGYVDVPSYSMALPSPVLDIQTYKENLILQITCLNYAALKANYSDLRLEVIRIGSGALSPILDLTSSDIFNYTLTAIGHYQFDYRIYYTPITPATNQILLNVDVIDGP